MSTRGLWIDADDKTIEWWTDPSVPGPRFGGTKAVFLLINKITISAAEEFCYDLQQQGRATLIGETTAGAANFDYRYRVSEHLMFSVPSGYPINSVPGQGWEGTGVQPHVTTEPSARVRARVPAGPRPCHRSRGERQAQLRVLFYGGATKALSDLEEKQNPRTRRT